MCELANKNHIPRLYISCIMFLMEIFLKFDCKLLNEQFHMLRCDTKIAKCFFVYVLISMQNFFFSLSFEKNELITPPREHQNRTALSVIVYICHKDALAIDESTENESNMYVEPVNTGVWNTCKQKHSLRNLCQTPTPFMVSVSMLI